MNRVRKHIGIFATSYGIVSGVLAALLCLLLAGAVSLVNAWLSVVLAGVLL